MFFFNAGVSQYKRKGLYLIKIEALITWVSVQLGGQACIAAIHALGAVSKTTGLPLFSNVHIQHGRGFVWFNE